MGTNYVELQKALFQLPPRGIFNASQVIRWLVSSDCNLPDFRKEEIRRYRSPYGTALRNLMIEIGDRTDEHRSRDYQRMKEKGIEPTADFRSCLTKDEATVLEPVFAREWQNGRGQIRFYAGIQFMFAAYLALSQDEVNQGFLDDAMWFGPDFANELLQEFHNAVKETKHEVVREGPRLVYMEHFKKVAADFAAGKTGDQGALEVSASGQGVPKDSTPTKEATAKTTKPAEAVEPETSAPAFQDPFPSDELPGETDIVRPKPVTRKPAKPRDWLTFIKRPIFSGTLAILFLGMMAAAPRAYSYLSTHAAVTSWGKGKAVSVVAAKGLPETERIKASFLELWDLVSENASSENEIKERVLSMLDYDGQDSTFHHGRAKLVMGLYYVHQDRYNEARRWLDESCTLFSITNSLNNMALCQNLIARTYWYQRQWGDAELWLETADATDGDDVNPLSEYWRGRVAFAKGNLSLAIQRTQTALEIYQKNEQTRQIALCHSAISMYCSIQGDAPTALKHLVAGRKAIASPRNPEVDGLEVAEFFLSIALAETRNDILPAPDNERIRSRLKLYLDLADLKEFYVD